MGKGSAEVDRKFGKGEKLRKRKIERYSRFEREANEEIC